MDIRILDENFSVVNNVIIDEFVSLTWTRKYNEVGNFTLQITLNDFLKVYDQAGLINDGDWEELYYDPQYNPNILGKNFVYIDGFDEVGIIETVKYSNSEDKKIVELSGRFFEALIGYRVINKTQNLNDTIENCCIKLFNTFANNTDEEERIISTDMEVTESQGLGSSSKVRFQVTGENLLDELYSLAVSDGLSIRMKPVLGDYDYMIFEVWQGKDRSIEQSKNKPAVFTRNYENILEEEYSQDRTQYKNFAYVYGEGTGSERYLIEVNHADTNRYTWYNTLQRRELYVDARDLQREDGMTEDEYKELLKQRGEEKLAECNIVNVADFTVDPFSNLKYKENFDLGDICTYVNYDLGVILNSRIVEITENYENNEMTLDITFGDNYNLKGVVNR